MNKPPTRGGFFVIEQETFRAACDLGMRPAVALLVLARFTGKRGTQTRASTNAIEQRTGIGRKAAREALDALIQGGVIRQEGSATRPRYIIVRAAERPDPRGVLSPRYAAVMARALNGSKMDRSEATIASTLVKQGFVRRKPNGGFEEIPREERTPVWLPNELVDGIEGRPSPVELVRQTGDVMTLRLLVDLYEWHRLDEWCGVDSRVVGESYREIFRLAVDPVLVLASAPETLRVQTYGPIAKPHVSMVNDRADLSAFWQRLYALQRCGLVRFVPHVVDGDGAVVYPCAPTIAGASRRGEPAEVRIGEAAFKAAEQILHPGTDESVQLSDALEADEYTYTPSIEAVVFIVPRHMEKASVVGIARLTFRPKTRATAAWLSELAQTAEQWEARFRGAAEHGEAAGIVGVAGRQSA